MRYYIPVFNGRIVWEDCTEDEWFSKGGAAGAAGSQRANHKYIRRVPMGTDPKTGKTRYRYFYSEASLAHRVKQGERVNLKEGGVVDVVSTHGGKVTLRSADGSTEEVSLLDLHDRLFAAYKDRAVKAAEKVAKRWAAAHYDSASSGGPRYGTASLRVARDSDSPATARKQYDKIKKAASEAHVDEHQARSLVVFLCKRQGWSAEAQAAVTDLMAKGTKSVAMVAANLRMIIRAAENLSGVEGKGPVRPEHVIEAAAVRFPGTDHQEDTFPSKWLETKNRLAKENIATEAAVSTLEAVVASGSKVSEAVLSYVQGTAKLDAGLEVERTAQAFPALRDDADLAKHRELAARFRAVAEKLGTSKPDGYGMEWPCYVADRDGFPVPKTIRYRVVEAESVIASHLPGSGFKQNAAYPEGVQERIYHIDKGEQNKVRGNATRFRPDLVHNTNPDAVNGPPVTTADGIVLGGNSRAMSMQLLYAEGQGERVKDHLAETAHQFGIDRAVVEKMRQPILIREMADVSSSSPKAELKDLVRATNESFTQAMDPRTMQVALAQKVNDGVLSQLSAMPSDTSLSDYLSATKTGREFVTQITAAGIIDRRNRSQYVREDGLLNNDGRNMVERLLVGKMVPDAELMGELPNSTMSALARIAPYVLSAAGSNPEHDITKDLRVALRTQVDMAYSGHKTLDEHLSQGRLKVGSEAILGDPPIAKNERARVLHDALKMGPLVLTRVMRKYADSAQYDRQGQMGLFGAPPTALEQLKTAIARHGPGAAKDAGEDGGSMLPGFGKGTRFVISQPTAPSGIDQLEAMLKADGGPFIGPRGGKWADPQHTIPWDENKHSRAPAKAKDKPKPSQATADESVERYRQRELRVAERTAKKFGLPWPPDLTHAQRGHLIANMSAHADGHHHSVYNGQTDKELRTEADRLGIDHQSPKAFDGEKLKGAVAAHPKSPPQAELDRMPHGELIAHAKKVGIDPADPKPFHGATHPRWQAEKGPHVDRAELAHVASDVGGGEWNEQFKVVVPHNPERVWGAWLKEREQLAARIGDTPQGLSQDEAEQKWTNDHSRTEEQLVDLAGRTKPAWTAAVRKIVAAIGGKVEAAFGDGDQHATKGIGSLTRKSKKIQEEKGLEPTVAVNRGVGDAIRGSVIVDTPEELGSAIREAVKLFGHENIVVDNKFVGKPNKSGYTAVHCDVWFPDANGTRMKAELQFHMRSFYDGSEANVKGQAHKLYEATRETHKGDAGLTAASHLLFLAGMRRTPPRRL